MNITRKNHLWMNTPGSTLQLHFQFNSENLLLSKKSVTIHTKAKRFPAVGMFLDFLYV